MTSYLKDFVSNSFSKSLFWSCTGLVPTSASEPPPFKCLLINKVDGSCRTFNDSEQEDLQGFGLCLDPVYDVIWRSVLNGVLLDYHI